MRIRRKSIGIQRRRSIRLSRTKPYPTGNRARIDECRVFFDTYFRMPEITLEETSALIGSMTVPVIQQERITLPYELNTSFAPGDCVSLSEMGYTLGIGGSCSLCTWGSSTATPMDLSALELTFMHHLSSMIEFKELVASLRVLAGESEIGGGYENKKLKEIIVDLLGQTSLFYAYCTVKSGVSQEFSVLLARADPRGPYEMYFTFAPGRPLHLSDKLLKQLISNCPGYRWYADVFSGAFLLAVRKDASAGLPEPTRAKLDAEAVYRRYCDVLVTDEKAHDYERLYSAFKHYRMPAQAAERTS